MNSRRRSDPPDGRSRGSSGAVGSVHNSSARVGTGHVDRKPGAAGHTAAGPAAAGVRSSGGLARSMSLPAHHTTSPTVYKSSAGRSAAAAGLNVRAGASPSVLRKSYSKSNSPPTSPHVGSSCSSPASPATPTLAPPGSLRGRSPSASPAGSKVGSASRDGATRGLRVATVGSNVAAPPDTTDNRLRRRLTDNFAGLSVHEHEDPRPSSRTHEPAREVGFSVISAPAGMTSERKTQIGKCTIRYSSSTHPGNDPGGYQKENQDAWVVKENFGNSKGLFFGVFDGHGYEGKKVSHALVGRMPKMLMASDKFKAGEFGQAAAQVCIECNTAIKRISTFSSDLSGSTGVMAYLHKDGKSLTVANVGDSRCILGRVLPGGVTEAVPITVDHTPTIPEEAARIRQFKGRISSFMHMGRPVGPLRVWLPDRDIPGLCMTRSFGDNIAATVGVSSRPDIHEVELTEADKYLLLVSDGLTEFMTNDELVEFVHEKASNGRGPFEIAKQLVRENRARWQTQEEGVVDDCTIILIFLQRESSSSSRSSPPSSSRSSQPVSSATRRGYVRSSVA